MFITKIYKSLKIFSHVTQFLNKCSYSLKSIQKSPPPPNSHRFHKNELCFYLFVFSRCPWADKLRAHWGPSEWSSETSASSRAETSPSWPQATDKCPDNSLLTTRSISGLCDRPVFQTCDWSDRPFRDTDRDSLPYRTFLDQERRPIHVVDAVFFFWLELEHSFSFTSTSSITSF